MSRRGVAPPSFVGSVADLGRKVGRLERQLGYRDWSRLRTSFDPLAGGGGRPPSTLVVAASDSAAPDADSADYVCDGTDDDLTIQAAIDELISSGTTGGRVLLLEGTYSVSPGVVNLYAPAAEYQQSPWLQGMGRGTVLEPDADTGDVLWVGDGGLISDLVVRWPNSRAGIVGVNVNVFGRVARVLCIEKSVASGSNVGFKLSNSWALLEDCIAYQCGSHGFTTTSGATDNRLLACHATGVGGDGFRVEGDRNWLLGCFEEDSGGDGYELTSTAGNNHLRDCHSRNSGAAALHISGGDDNYVAGCNFMTPGTWNVLVDSGSTGNIIVGNDLTQAGLSGTWSDAGTGTVNTWPNNATEGDNFI